MRKGLAGIGSVTTPFARQLGFPRCRVLPGNAEALKQLWLLTSREAQTQTFADVFLCIMICFVIAALMVPLMRKAVIPPRPLTDAH